MNRRIRSTLKKSGIYSLFVLVLFIYLAKTGKRYGVPHFNPVSWDEVFYQFPYILGLTVIFFICAMMWNYTFYKPKIEPKNIVLKAEPPAKETIGSVFTSVYSNFMVSLIIISGCLFVILNFKDVIKYIMELVT